MVRPPVAFCTLCKWQCYFCLLGVTPTVSDVQLLADVDRPSKPPYAYALRVCAKTGCWLLKASIVKIAHEWSHQAPLQQVECRGGSLGRSAVTGPTSPQCCGSPA